MEGHVGNLVDKTQADGQRVSPALPKGIKNYLIDIDGTVGEDIPNEEPERMATAEAFPDAIKTINSWYDQGHRICFFTARTEEHRDVTERWLSQKGFHYHTLLMGKPREGIIIGSTTTWSEPRGIRINSATWLQRMSRLKYSRNDLPNPSIFDPLMDTHGRKELRRTVM